MRKSDVSIPSLLVVLLVTLACSGSSQDSVAGDPAAEPPATAPTTAPATDDNFAPVSSRGGQSTPNIAAPPAADDTTVDHQIDAPGATFTLPAAWQPQAPSSSMRLAQASIPGSAGSGQLTAFYFGPGGGGGVDSNLERWAGQVDPDPGFDAQRDGFEVDGFKVTWLEVQGTLKPSTMGTGPTTPQPNSRLFGAVIEGPQGPWFFKATGPAQSLDEQREAFLELLRSVRPRN